MLVETSLAALAAGEQVQVGPGDTLRVSCNFKYTVAQAITVTLWAALGLGLGRDIESFKEISLESTLTPKTWTGDIDIPIPTSGKSNGTYWLQAEIKGYPETVVKIDNAVVISGMAGVFDISSIMGLMMVVMMMGMIMPMMEEGEA
jgi:hypothetical protein